MVKKYLILGVVGAFFASFLISNITLAQKVDTQFWSNNDVLYYDSRAVPCGPAGGTATPGSSTLSGADNLEKILRFYVSKGLTLAQAAGIAGNYQQESGFNPSIIQGGAIADESYVPVNSVGFGIAQWTFTGRQQPLVDMGKSSGRAPNDLSLQLDYSWWEMETQSGQSMSLEEFKATTTPEDAAWIFHRDYEVSADSEVFVKQVRGGNANEIFNQFKDIIKDGAAGSTGSATGAVCAAPSGTGEDSLFTADGFPVYNQFDEKWQSTLMSSGETIAVAGCGPSSMASIISALTKKTVTPVDTVKYINENRPELFIAGVGSSHDITPVLSAQWGLKADRIGRDLNLINSSLREGKLILTSGSGASPFTKGGHIIVIRGITADGKWKIADSNGEAGITNSDKEWEPNDIYVNMATTSGNVWAISL